MVRLESTSGPPNTSNCLRCLQSIEIPKSCLVQTNTIMTLPVPTSRGLNQNAQQPELQNEDKVDIQPQNDEPC